MYRIGPGHETVEREPRMVLLARVQRLTVVAADDWLDRVVVIYVRRGRTRLSIGSSLRGFPEELQNGILGTLGGFASGRASCLDGEQAPGSGNSLEVVLAPLGELDARADHQVLNRARDQDFPRGRQSLYTRGDVYSESS